MYKYQIIEEAGSGNFSNVYKAMELVSGEIVAIKDMKEVDENQQFFDRQLRILTSINHPNLIKTKQIIQKGTDIKIVFQYFEENLLQFYQNSEKGLNENQIKCILYQAAFGLEYLHSKKKIIHRDIKPQNILIDKKQGIVKIIDFGLAKEEDQAMTSYVATRWYRAPENLIGLKKFTTAIDIFSLGCVIFELATSTPLFPGDNTIDQLVKVFNVLGSPTQQNWTEGCNQLKRKEIYIQHAQKTNLKDLMPNSSDLLVDLLEKMLNLDPRKRLKAREIMQHSFFQNVGKMIPTSIYNESLKYFNGTKQDVKTIKKEEKVPLSNLKYCSRKNSLANPIKVSGGLTTAYFFRKSSLPFQLSENKLTNFQCNPQENISEHSISLNYQYSQKPLKDHKSQHSHQTESSEKIRVSYIKSPNKLKQQENIKYISSKTLSNKSLILNIMANQSQKPE